MRPYEKIRGKKKRVLYLHIPPACLFFSGKTHIVEQKVGSTSFLLRNHIAFEPQMNVRSMP